MKDPSQMAYSELKSWLADRLQMKGAAAADIDMRTDEAPYQKPVKLWKSARDEFRSDFKRAILDLVEEAGEAPWPPEHFHELALLIESANLWEAARPLEAIAQSPRMLQNEHGAKLRMLALRTLLALGWTGTPDFWLAQKQQIGERWPSIIFEGLAQHDLSTAFQRLPELIADRDAMRTVLNLFPGLMRDLRIAMSTLRANCRDIVGELPPGAAEAMHQWFQQRKYPLESPSVRTIHPSLLEGIQRILPDENKPREFSPMLCSSAPYGHYAA